MAAVKNSIKKKIKKLTIPKKRMKKCEKQYCTKQTKFSR